MGQLFNRNVLLGVTGGIAAYKSAQLVRDLQEAGASVRVVMTHGATGFITPLTLQALSGNPVHLELLDSEAEAGMGHIELARWADLVLIAPATADFISRLVQGRADDLLTSLCLAAAAPLLLAPAMNQGMWRDPATQANIASLDQRSVHRCGPAEGDQACGDVGPGRMEEPIAIVAAAGELFSTRLLEGKRITITAGPTREALDPIRYLSNHSSGKMGYAVARAAADAGAVTTLISGPVELTAPERVETIAVTSAGDMYAASMAQMGSCDIFVGCAAVADYRPATSADQKIKKGPDSMSLELVPNPDIISAVASHAQRPFTVGFAAETRELEAYALEKMKNKGLDMIVANDISRANAGFNSEYNAATIFWQGGHREVELIAKDQLARILVEAIADNYD